MKPTYACIVLACVLFSCNTIKSLSSKNDSFPMLGAVGKYQGTMLATQFILIGHPILETPIAVSVQTLPVLKQIG